MAKSKFYAVREGRKPGIYFNWDDCKAQVDQYPGAEFKSFHDLDGAYDYMKEKEAAASSAIPMPEGPYAFVDGSFNPKTGVYGYGGFLDVNGRRYPLMGSGNDPEMASMRNVAGEISGSMAAVRKAEELGLWKVTLLYDYAGIEGWARSGWKTNREGTAAYQRFMQPGERKVDIEFQHVKAHTGIEGNEMADVLAKQAVGIKLTGPQQKLLEQAMQSGLRNGLDVDVSSDPEDQCEFG